MQGNGYMAFAAVPPESRSQINKAGRELSEPLTLSGMEIRPLPTGEQWDLASRWRLCHAYPINTFQSTLRSKLGKNSLYKKSNVAQRLKRMPTIIDKLRRYPSMQLTRMQDIAGVRAILPTVDKAIKLADEYRYSKNLPHTLVNVKDYIASPRDEDGYRSIHLVYKYKNAKNQKFNGLIVELQIRSQLQHIWATAVETMGTILGQALKSRQGDQAWLEFFAIVSAACAHIEKRPTPPRFSTLSVEEVNCEVARAESKISALNLMQGLPLAINMITSDTPTGKGYYYHLIILDSIKRYVTITPYSRDNFQEAVSAWEKIEKRVAGGEKLEPVLVAAGTLRDTKRAYPNFFLDINKFVGMVRSIVSEASA